MMNMNENILFLDKSLQCKRGISTDLALSEYIPAVGELVIATDTGEIRYGDGVNVWKNIKTCDNTIIENNLETVETGKVLSAAQGRVLNNRLITLEGINGIDCGEILEAVIIDRDNSEPITDFEYYKNVSMLFTATYEVSEQTMTNTPIWSVEGLPAGLTYSVSDAGLTISGYATEVTTKNVTISLQRGNCSDTKTYVFDVKNVASINITNSDLGTWNVGFGGSATLTSSITGSMTGTTKYYATNMPSWMSLNSSTGQLSGVASSGGVSNYIYAYATKGDYLSPTKALRYTTVDVLPSWKYSQITIDVTELMRRYSSGYYDDLLLTGLCTPSYLAPEPSKTFLSFSGNTNAKDLGIATTSSSKGWVLRLKKLTSVSATSVYSRGFYINITNDYGSASIYVYCKIVTKSTWQNNYNKYYGNDLIVTYS